MTNEEASNILDDYDINFEGHTAEEIAKAFDVTFKALSVEPCEDAISRQAAFDAINAIVKDYEEHSAKIDYTNDVPINGRPEEPAIPNNPARNTALKYSYKADGAEKVKEAIQALLPVTPARPKGKWIPFDGGWECSECHSMAMKMGWRNSVRDHKYCYNCGADMREE